MTDPYLGLARVRAATLPLPRATFVCVYDESSIAIVSPLAREAQAAGMGVRLWSLRGDPGSLADLTYGHGPGTRGENLNRLASSVPPDHYLIGCDDDVRMQPGALVRFLKLAHRLSFDLAQPAQGPGSHVAHAITRRNRRVMARQTEFVESGPLTAYSPAIRPKILPFPEDGYGWGVEILWHDLLQEGHKFGIVDATPMWHLREPAANYDFDQEFAKVRANLQARRFQDWQDVQKVVRAVRWT